MTSDGSPLPADLKLFRRVSGEATTETSVSRDGTFSFNAAPQSGSVRFAIKSGGYAPFDSGWVKLESTLTLTLSRGAAVTLRMQVPHGAGPLSGRVRLIVPWYDDDEQGEFPVDANGIVAIAHCPEQTVDLDVRVPGYEELRIHRLVRGDLTLDVPLTPAQPTKLRIVSTKDGQPIAGAKLRFFSRVRAGSFLMPFRYYGNDEIWGESDADGLVVLTTLRAIDPVPTNMPGLASYAFRIDAPNHAPRYLGDVQAGADLGDIAFAEPLEVRGEIAHELNERVSLQVRQPTVAQGGSDGRGDWMTAPTVNVNGKATFHLTNLQPRQFDLYILYSNAAEPQDSPRGTIQQLQFHGMLTGSSSDLKITRVSVTPGDKNLTSRRGTLSPIEEDRSNVPSAIVHQFVAQVTMVLDAGGTVIAQELKPTLQPLFVWSNTAPVQHSMGYVSWRLFVLQDGTVFIPGDMSNREAGILHKLPAAELQELKDLLEKHRELFGRQVPKELPQFAGWRHGHESLLYTKDGATTAFVNWHGLDEPPLVGEFNPTGAHQAIVEHITRLMSDVAYGGREARTRFRELANQALAVVLPKATPFDDADWTNATTQSDGTKTIRFTDTHERTEVTLIQPSFEPAYVERVEHQGKRIPFDPKSIGGLSATGERSPSPVAPGTEQAPLAEPKPGQTGHGVVLSVRGRVLIDGAIPDVPPLKVKPGLMLVIPRNDDDKRANEQRQRDTPVVEVPDDSLVIGKEGGLANVAIYLKKAPADWKPSDPPSASVELRSADLRFQPRMSFVRVGQPILLINTKIEAQDFDSLPVRSNSFNVVLPMNTERRISTPFNASERLPTVVKSNIHPWQSSYLLALDHPFAVITDADGRFEIRDLPTGEHHFTVWHERRGYLNKDLVIRVEHDKVMEIDLKYTAEQLERPVRP